MFNVMLRLRALVDRRAAQELARQKALKARQEALKAEREAAEAKARAEESESEHRRINYNEPINFLGGTDYPEPTPEEWAYKRATWSETEYATTDPTFYGSMGDVGSMAGQPYEVIEAEVRRRMAAIQGLKL